MTHCAKHSARSQVRRNGFTLIELLVVISIIGILAGLLFPVFARARAQAHSTACLTQLAQLSKAYEMYVTDYDGQCPKWYQIKPEGGYRYWPQSLYPYIRDRSILNDPALNWNQDPTKLAEYSLLTWGPGGDGTRDRPYWRWAGQSEHDTPPNRPFSESRILRPSETIAIVDGYTNGSGESGVMFRHFGGFNAAMHDGHARFFRRDRFDHIAEQNGFYYYYFCSADK